GVYQASYNRFSGLRASSGEDPTDFRMHLGVRLTAGVVGNGVQGIEQPAVLPFPLTPFGFGFDLLAMFGLTALGFALCLPLLPLAEPVFGFFDFTVDLALFEYASADGYLLGGPHNIVGGFRRE